jgi:L-seryl-tRNA(Ser) seleniumtransferase
VDGATTVPPRANLTKHIPMGADMVTISGGKGIRGPQGSGLLFGRGDLIEAAAANASPNQALGRPMKVAKEEIVGLVTALERFVEEDEEQEMREYAALAQPVVDALSEVPGLEVSLKHNELDYLIPTAVMRFGKDWRGPSRDQIAQAMQLGDPPIHLHQLGEPDELAVDPLNLREDEVEVIISRLREELLR